MASASEQLTWFDGRNNADVRAIKSASSIVPLQLASPGSGAGSVAVADGDGRRVGVAVEVGVLVRAAVGVVEGVAVGDAVAVGVGRMSSHPGICGSSGTMCGAGVNRAPARFGIPSRDDN